MYQSMNQFKPKVEAGQIALDAVEGKAINVMIASDYAGTGVKNGDVVELVSTSTGPEIIVTPKTTGGAVGIVAANAVKNKYKAGDFCTVFISGKFVYAEIGEAVNAGDELTWDNSTMKFVKKTAGTVDAIAVDKTGAGLSRVVVKGIF